MSEVDQPCLIFASRMTRLTTFFPGSFLQHIFTHEGYTVFFGGQKQMYKTKRAKIRRFSFCIMALFFLALAQKRYFLFFLAPKKKLFLFVNVQN